jgi:hypothetical protein
VPRPENILHLLETSWTSISTRYINHCIRTGYDVHEPCPVLWVTGLAVSCDVPLMRLTQNPCLLPQRMIFRPQTKNHPGVFSNVFKAEFVNIRRYSTVVFTRPPVADQVRRREVGLPEETSGKLTNKLLWNCGHSIFRLKRHCITGLRVSYCSSTEYLGTPHNSDLWDFPWKSLNEGYMSSMLRT